MSVAIADQTIKVVYMDVSYSDDDYSDMSWNNDVSSWVWRYDIIEIITISIKV